ncbi:MAG: tetratricopeptide repeat protein [Acidobacteria bacterium]|nr:tetratricopeptide repeat protein [Acidobacteriota bacterium]
MDKPAALQRFQHGLVILALLLLTMASFWPVLDHDFVSYDDDVYVTTNRQVQQGLSSEGLHWAFTTTYGANWHPLTWLSHMTDCQLFGLNPYRHHLINLLFHLANTALLLCSLTLMTGDFWRSAFAAALFAIHPMHVESVAWVSERKDVLSAFFWMLTMLTYTHYVQRPSPRRYLLVLLPFILGLMAKPMLVTLPFVLLLLDYWPLRRVKWHSLRSQGSRLAREKLPFFALTVASSAVTFWAQRAGGAVQTLQGLALPSRIANAAVSYAEYIEKMVWPRNLAVFYPHPETIATGKTIAAFLLLACLTVLVIQFAGRHPYLIVGWLWYLGTLVPAIGLVQVGEQAMADRYSYLPFIGMFIMIAWGIPAILAGWANRKVILSLSAAAVIFLLAVRTWFQAGYWHDSIALFERAIEVVPGNYLAHNNLGFRLAEEGRLDQAIAHYSEALKIRPRFILAHNNLGAALAAQGRTEEALAHYYAALQIRPNQAEANTNVGIELATRGKIKEALFHFSRALKFDPDDAKTHYNLGLTLAGQGKTEQAIAHYLWALHAKRDYAEAHVSLGVALAQQGKLDEAIMHYAQALQIKPNYPEAHINMGIELARQGKFDEAIKHFTEAARIRPNSAEAHFNLAKAYLYIGNRSSALEEYRILSILDPTLADALKNMMGQ